MIAAEKGMWCVRGVSAYPSEKVLASVVRRGIGEQVLEGAFFVLCLSTELVAEKDGWWQNWRENQEAPQSLTRDIITCGDRKNQFPSPRHAPQADEEARFASQVRMESLFNPGTIAVSEGSWGVISSVGL